MKKISRLIVALPLAAAALGLVSCSSGAPEEKPGTGANEENAGSVSLALQLASGSTVNTFSYTLTGPTSLSGTIDVSHSSTVSALIGGVPAGQGYVLALTGTSTDGKATCSGTSGMFNVAAGVSTSVTVGIDCRQGSTSGSVLVSGTVNVCPAVDSVSANPAVGLAIALSSSAHDSDAGPQPISYHWTTSSGTLSDASAQNPTLTCTQPGVVTLELTVNDGDTACGDTFEAKVQCPSDADLADPAWVEIGAANQAIARVITPYPVCPSITIDGTDQAMHLRVGPATEPLRPTSSDPTVNPSSPTSKPSVFPVSTCEFSIPASAQSAKVAGKALALPKANVQRVVVLGDTGCRVSIGNPWQACNDPTQWPFSVISKTAAGMKPDLVLHVGDYQYRDNACPSDVPGCQGPWGYGYDTWAADLFVPAAPLLAAAPWIMVRGNHETCNRAGQGWYRFLDPNPYADTKSCNDPANDDAGNYNDPWAVTFGDTQVVAFDSANTSKSAYSPSTKPADVVPFNNYTAELATAGTFTANTGLLSIFAVHHPILGFTPGSPATGGNPGMLSVMKAAYSTAYYPPGVGLAMHGHVHDFQGINFSSGHPATFVAGHGGDNLDAALPNPFTPGLVPAAGTVIDKIAYSASFGFMVMDRVGAQNWTITAYRVDGTVLTTCTMGPPPPCSGCTAAPARQITCSSVGSLM
jgi:hypothetical protein